MRFERKKIFWWTVPLNYEYGILFVCPCAGISKVYLHFPHWQGYKPLSNDICYNLGAEHRNFQILIRLTCVSTNFSCMRYGEGAKKNIKKLTNVSFGLREAIIRKKILFYEKVSQTGGGGHLVFIPLFFFKDCVESPLCGDHKLDRLRDNFWSPQSGDFRNPLTLAEI